jgi:hypothetical protein
VRRCEHSSLPKSWRREAFKNGLIGSEIASKEEQKKKSTLVWFLLGIRLF